MIRTTSRLINKRYTSLISHSSNNANIFTSNLLLNNNKYRSFHSSNQSYFLFDVLDKIKDKFSGDKSKKEYPSNQKDLEDKTKSNLEQQKNSPTKLSPSTTTTAAAASTISEEEKAEKINKENQDYHKFLESNIPYDFNIFRKYLVQYKDQTSDQAKKQELESHIRIIDCMSQIERDNPFVFHKAAFKLRSRLIKDSNTDIKTFNEMINTFTNARMLNNVLRSFKKQGKPIPDSASGISDFLKSNPVEVKKEFDKIKAAEARKL